LVASASGDQESSDDEEDFNEADDMKDDTQDLTGADAGGDGKVFLSMCLYLIYNSTIIMIITSNLINLQIVWEIDCVNDEILIN